ncbi:MAG: pantoate--beta-alanine ligase [Tepidisphaeraceae bacterium]
MEVLSSINDFRQWRKSAGSVGFVPTMGALHPGHLSLVTEAKRRAEKVVASIFVNPTQFGPREDFSRYPRPIEADLKLCEDAGVHAVFTPTPEDMYRPGSKITVDLPELTTVLEGKHRPGHFQGVCQIVAKLFNIVQPNAACFGRKDFQQLRVISAMVEALDFPVEIVGCPTVRENDGLAMSSRNRYLTPDQRARALSISRALYLAAEAFDAGATVASRLVTIMQRTLLEPGNLGHVQLTIDYVACVDPLTLKPADTLDTPAICCIAARVGDTRLIDNLLLSS